jgi:hypothetical protein
MPMLGKKCDRPLYLRTKSKIKIAKQKQTKQSRKSKYDKDTPYKHMELNCKKVLCSMKG